MPGNMEKMSGSIDNITWDGWEFSREEGSANWRKPKQLMPY